MIHNNYLKYRKMLFFSVIFTLTVLGSFYIFADAGGRTGRTSSTSAGCSGSGCHAASASTATSISVTSGSGSFTVQPGSTTTFTITITNSAKVAAGCDIGVKTTETGSTNAGSLVPINGEGLRLSASELTHSSPKNMNGGSVTFSFQWTAPVTPGNYYLRVAGNAVNGNGQPDAGDIWNWMTPQILTVASPSSITLTAPNGGEIWCQGTSQNITWSSTGVTNIMIELSSDGGNNFSTLVASTPAANNSWNWNVPSNQSTGSQYVVRLSDASNPSVNVLSSSVFTIGSAIIITTQPVSQTSCTGKNCGFVLAATGTNLLYKWQKNGIDIPGANQVSYNIPSVAESDSGNYTCIVTGSCGTPVTSNTAHLTVNITPAINSQPSPDTVCVGEPASFSVGAIGTQLTYQWRKNGTNINGANSDVYNISNVAVSDTGYYDVIVNGICNTPQTSLTAKLIVNLPPAITQLPAPLSLCSGQSGIMYVKATGSKLIFKWAKNGVDIPNSNNDTLFLKNVTSADAGDYTVTVSGICTPATTSNPATLTIDSKPQFASQPQNKTVTEGTDIDFSVSTTSTNAKYQWRKDKSILIGKTTSALHLTAVKQTDGGSYDCIISNTCGSDTSNPAVLTVNKASGGPNLSLSTEEVDFGTVITNNSRDTTLAAIITNKGDQNLVITAIALQGPSQSEFQLNLSGTLPVTLTPSQSMSLTISFKPVSTGQKTAQAVITSNSASNTPVLVLKGNSGSYAISSITDLTFSTTDRTKPANQNFTVHNTGTLPVNINLKIYGTDSTDFNLLSPANIAINPADSSVVSVSYLPASNNKSKALLNLLIKETNKNVSIALNGQFLTSVNDNTSIADEISVYPNPANSGLNIVLTLNYPVTAKAMIYDSRGNIVKNFGYLNLSQGFNLINWNGKTDADEPLTSGVYFMNLTSGSMSTTLPIVITR